MKIKIIALCAWVFAFSYPLSISAQNTPVTDEDALFIRKIYDAALTESRAYPWLSTMCTQIGGRLSGSAGAAKAVEWTKKMLDSSGFTTRLQPCLVTNWKRGDKEVVKIKAKKGDIALRCLAIGNSVGTGKKGVEAEVIEVKSLDEVDALGEKVKGKIVFYNRPMNRKQINTFAAYGGAGDQRRSGASRAAKYGALAVLVRSLSTELDDRPHTGSLVYDEKYPKIAAVCISTNDAEMLSKTLSQPPHTQGGQKVFIRTTCEVLPDAPSFNVIGEIRGSEFPDEIIVIGGHLDSWDVAQGAHDDGAGCVQSMDVLNLMKQMGYKPKRTIRCVLFMNEENGLKGGVQYAADAVKLREKHIFAVESDAGGFTPRGISFEADPSVFVEKFKKVGAWEDLLKPYGIELTKGSSGADIGPMKPQKFLLGGLRPDSQRYFDFHHTEFDKIEYVNRRELELGSAAMTALVCLIDKYGL
ncbi:MAG: M20/M25/M40 family metallo-hydrolase [Saprospiraceae bacterium]|nr:M20/M25/M40 family metallo-hydrolase [Saprospiraceae bacterium]